MYGRDEFDFLSGDASQTPEFKDILGVGNSTPTPFAGLGELDIFSESNGTLENPKPVTTHQTKQKESSLEDLVSAFSIEKPAPRSSSAAIAVNLATQTPTVAPSVTPVDEAKETVVIDFAKYNEIMPGLVEMQKKGISLKPYLQHLPELVSTRLQTRVDFEIAKKEKHSPQTQRKAFLKELLQRYSDRHICLSAKQELPDHLQTKELNNLLCEAIKLGVIFKDILNRSISGYFGSMASKAIDEIEETHINILLFKVEARVNNLLAMREDFFKKNNVFTAPKEQVDPETCYFYPNLPQHDPHLWRQIVSVEEIVAKLFVEINNHSKFSFTSALSIIPQKHPLFVARIKSIATNALTETKLKEHHLVGLVASRR